MSIVFLAVCGVIWHSHGIPQRYPQLVLIDNAALSLQLDPCHIHDGIDQPNLTPRCYGASGNRPAIALWGDSHAAALAPGLRRIVNTAGYDFAQLSKSACHPMSDVGLDRRSISPSAECIRFNRHVLDRLETDRRIRIVILVNAWGHMFSQPATVEAVVDGIVSQPGSRTQNPLQIASLQFLETSIRSLLADGKQVVVMEDVPEFSIDPLANYRTIRIPARHTLAKWLGEVDDNHQGLIDPELSSKNTFAIKQIRNIIANLPGATLVDLRQEFCSQPDRCIYRKDSALLYLDHQHLSPAGAEYALRDFHIPLASAR